MITEERKHKWFLLAACILAVVSLVAIYLLPNPPSEKDQSLHASQTQEHQADQANVDTAVKARSAQTTTTAPPTTLQPTTTRPTPSTVRAARSGPATPPPTSAPAPVDTTTSGPSSTGQTQAASSTAYCLTSQTANGERGYDGSVAMNGVPFGSQWKVHDGPMAGRIFTVNDRIGHSSQFDIWMSSCNAAIQYGRKHIHIERV